MSTRTIVLLMALALISVACAGGGQPASEAGDPGALLIRPVYEPPPADEPISIGGYGFFATVDDGDPQQVPFEDVLRIEVPAGTHTLTVVTRPQSDVLEPGQEQPEFYEATAECMAEVEVPAGETVEVVYRAIGGNTCEILMPEG